MKHRVLAAAARGMAAFALAVATVGIVAAPASASAAINGGGSSFAALEMDQWHADTAVHPFNLNVNYVSQGSTFGRSQFSAGNLDFGASDIEYLSFELPDLQRQRCQGRAPDAGCFVYVPVSAGGVSFMYNLTDSSGNRLNNLQFTRRAACKIFTGAITKWNDPEIVATNPRLASFNRDIVPVIRSDGAGESFVLSQFCIAVAPDVWHAFIAEREQHDPANVADDFKAGQPVSNWPQGWAHSTALLYADNVANAVASPDTGANAITYVAAGYAKVRNFPVASLQNAAGVFTQPDENNVTVALGYATGRPNGTFALNFTGADRRAYFPSTYSYVLAQTTGFDPSKGATLGQFLCYAISEGQVVAPSLRYARLSAPLVQIAINAIRQIPGAPDASHCYLATAPPPPPPPSVAPGQIPPGATPDGGSSSNQQGAGANSGRSGATTPGQGTSAGAGANASQGAASASGCATTTSSASAPTTTTSRPKRAAAGVTTTRHATTTTASTTTTTSAPCAASLEGKLAQGESPDAKLAAATRQNSGSHSSSTTWLLALGVGVAWAASAALSRRRATP
jgi:phosphate transport system substrate-binding protein